VNHLRELREAQGLVRGSLAAKAGCSPSTIGAIENWDYVPGLTIRHRIARTLKVRVDQVWSSIERPIDEEEAAEPVAS
jgi:DNA-binding XRE family transcriptional regulator